MAPLVQPLRALGGSAKSQYPYHTCKWLSDHEAAGWLRRQSHRLNSFGNWSTFSGWLARPVKPGKMPLTLKGRPTEKSAQGAHRNGQRRTIPGMATSSRKDAPAPFDGGLNRYRQASKLNARCTFRNVKNLSQTGKTQLSPGMFAVGAPDAYILCWWSSLTCHPHICGDGKRGD